jgi:hypothetical protein
LPTAYLRAGSAADVHLHAVPLQAGPTSPEFVRDFLNDLYRYELRRLRDRLVRREIAKPDYYAHVVDVRHRYPLLSRKLWEWTEE